MLHREVQGEALPGETAGPAVEPRNQESGMPMLLSEAEGNTGHGDIRQSCSDPARSESLCTSGSPPPRNWVITAVPGAHAHTVSRRQLVLRQNSGQAFHHGQALRQTDTKHEQEIMHLIDRLGAVSDQRFAQPMQLSVSAIICGIWSSRRARWQTG